MTRFVPQKHEKIQISLWVDERLLEEVDALAAAIDISRSACLVQCIAFALSHRRDKQHADDDNGLP